MSELASRSSPPSRRRISSTRRARARSPRSCARFDERAFRRGLAAAASAGSRAAIRRSRRACARSTIRRPGSSSGARRARCSSTVGRGRRRARLLGLRRRRRRLARARAAAAGVLVVSGLARGIDAAAHRVRSRRTTVAVLGCGIDRDYPRAHAAARRSDRAARPDRLGVPARRRTRALAFPARNRIVAGLASRPWSSKHASAAAR